LLIRHDPAGPVQKVRRMPIISSDGRLSIVAKLRAAGCVFAEDEAALLIESASSNLELKAMLAKRIAGHPIEHILGWSEFCGVRVALAPDVFVPRRRTELLAREAVRLLGERAPGERRVVDLCCGSGALGAAVAALVSGVDVYAADVHHAAVRCARRNIREDRVYQGDLFDALPQVLCGSADLVIANAPYVPSAEIDMLPREARLYEPLIALDGGPDGLDVHRRISAQARRWLRPGGHLLIETGEHQAPDALEMFERNGLIARIVPTEDVDTTVICGTSPQE
jgi:release factor glutamine methyltransferase